MHINITGKLGAHAESTQPCSHLGSDYAIVTQCGIRAVTKSV